MFHIGTAPILEHSPLCISNCIGSSGSTLRSDINKSLAVCCEAVQIRVSGYGGWFLLRLSLHDPVLPLNIEVKFASLFIKYQGSGRRWGVEIVP